jgi:hypothetical protein
MSDASTNLDILSAPDNRPALSATSDSPAIDSPKPAAEVKPEVALEEDGGAEEADVEAAEGAEEEAVEGDQEAPAPAAVSPPPTRWAEHRLARQRAEADAREAHLAAAAERANVERLTALVEKLTAAQTEAAAKPAEPAALEPLPRPRREAFADPDSYDAAVDDWATQNARRAAELTVAEVERRQAEQRTAEDRARTETETHQRWEALRSTYEERRAALVADPAYADYAEVAEAPTLQVSESMIPPLMNVENGPSVLYHLGKNPTEAARIAKLDPLAQAVEIGKLSATLAQPVRAQPTRAPRPLEPVGNRASAGPRDVEDMSMDEYANERLSKLRSERRSSVFGVREG